MSQSFTESASRRLRIVLKNKRQHEIFTQLTPDASTREYFRINWNNKDAIACVYPEAFTESLPYLDVTGLFRAAGLPVAEIYGTDFDHGIVIHEDFGDRILRDELPGLTSEKRDELMNQAIKLIARIQGATDLAFERDSIAAKLKFDEEKLVWELDFFKTHYFDSLRDSPLEETLELELAREFIELSKELGRYATVLTHRDFHAANLMVVDSGELKIIDHQDARLGSVAYDLVSLLLDRVTEIPTREWLREKKLFLLRERESIGLNPIEFEQFNYEFELMTVQRCLKAIGTFSNQAANFGKTRYVEYIDPMFQIVLEASDRLQRFPNLQKIIRDILKIK